VVIKDKKFVYGVVCDGCGFETQEFKQWMHYLPKGWTRLSLYDEISTGFGDYSLTCHIPDREYCPECTKRISKNNLIPNSFISNVKILKDPIDYKLNDGTRRIKKSGGGKGVKFRKKPIIVEAKQWFKMGDHPDVIPVTQYVTPWQETKDYGWIKTLEGGHVVTPGDWIITGVKGEHYPCKPDIFKQTYERVKERKHGL